MGSKQKGFASMRVHSFLQEFFSLGMEGKNENGSVASNLLPIKLNPFTLTELQIRRGIEDNSKIIFLISQ